MTGIKQSDFNAVTSIDDADNVPLFTAFENKRITYANMRSQLTDEIAVRFIYPTTAQLQQSNLEADEDEPNYVRCEETEYRLYKITALAAGVDDIALDNGMTATYQEEYSKSGFVLGAASSTNNALALFDGVTGTQLKTGAVLSTIGGNLASATSIAQVSYPRAAANNSVTMATPTTLKTDLNLPSNTAASISNIESDISTIEGDIVTIESDIVDINAELAIKVQTVETWAAISTVTPNASGQVFTLKQHTSGGIGGGTLMAFVGSVTDDNCTQKNCLGGYYLKRTYQGAKHSDWAGCYQAANQTLALNNFLLLAGDLVIDPYPSPYMIDPTLNPLPASNFGGLDVQSNTNLEIPVGTNISSLPASVLFTCTIKVYNKTNVKIFGGGKVRGEKSTHIGVLGEHGMGILVLASTDVTIDGINIDNCWGDGLYIGYASIDGVHTKCKNVRANANTIYDCRRQGISVTGCDGYFLTKNTIHNITGIAPAAAIDLEPDSVLYPNTTGVVSDNIGYECELGLALFTANIGVTGSGNYFSSRGPALTVNGSGQVDVNVTGVFNGGLDGVSPSVSFDGSGFDDMSTVHLTAPSIITGGGTQGVLYTGVATKYIDIRGVHIKQSVAQSVAISNSGNNFFYDNVIESSGAALSGASKTVVYSTDGVFGNNKYLNTTGQTPAYQYIGTTRIAQPEIKLGEDLNTLNDWRSAKSWTPTLGTTGTQPTTVTYNSNTGATYSKVGDIIFIQGQLRTSAVTVGPATGSIVIDGLPFPAVANTGSTLDGYGSICISNSATWSKAPLSGIISSGESRIRLQTRATFAGDTTDTVVADLTAGAGNIVFFSGWYKTTAT